MIASSNCVLSTGSAELFLGGDDLQQHAARQVVAALVIHHLDALAGGDEFAQVIQCHVAAVTRVVQAPVGVFAYEAFFGHGDCGARCCWRIAS